MTPIKLTITAVDAVELRKDLSVDVLQHGYKWADTEHSIMEQFCVETLLTIFERLPEGGDIFLTPAQFAWLYGHILEMPFCTLSEEMEELQPELCQQVQSIHE